MVRLFTFLVAVAAFAAPPALGQTLTTLPVCGDELAGGAGGPCRVTGASAAMETKRVDGRTVRVFRGAGSGEAEPDAQTAKPGPKTLSAAAPRSGFAMEKGVAIYRGDPVSTPRRRREAAASAARVRAEKAKRCEAPIIRRADRRDGERRYDVCVNDLDAAQTPEGVRNIYAALQRAAFLACPIDGRRVSERGQRVCMRGLVDEAIEASGIAPLALYHERFRSRRYDNRVAIVSNAYD